MVFFEAKKFPLSEPAMKHNHQVIGNVLLDAKPQFHVFTYSMT